MSNSSFLELVQYPSRQHILGLLLQAVLLFASASGNSVSKYVPHCVLRCKDAHMMQMENEWSMDFAFPLLSLLKSTGNESLAYNRAKEICQSNALLVACLENCGNSMESNLLTIGLMPWRNICENLNELRAQFPCWRNHVDSLSIGCRAQGISVRDSYKYLTYNDSMAAVERICINLEDLSDCTIKEFAQFCGSTSEEYVSRLFAISREAINSMLNMKWPKLPPACGLTSPQRYVYSTETFQLNSAEQQCHILSLNPQKVLLFLFSFLVAVRVLL
ncbi:hypothetical protein AB6A40_003459 [Gnathostoma spinigerum]|uniref:Uncharacterized protein n=1 Tax=Gnathostoma spinigerum TaxID=75299 RepID=A0ABD6EAT8_9BILA